jgi:hypothetical protein
MSGLHPAQVLLQLPGRGFADRIPSSCGHDRPAGQIGKTYAMCDLRDGKGRQVSNHACHEDRQN